MIFANKKSDDNFEIGIDGNVPVVLEELFALLLAMRDQFIPSQCADLELFQQMILEMVAPDSWIWNVKNGNTADK